MVDRTDVRKPLIEIRVQKKQINLGRIRMKNFDSQFQYHSVLML